jgi:hypothetical protein
VSVCSTCKYERKKKQKTKTKKEPKKKETITKRGVGCSRKEMGNRITTRRRNDAAGQMKIEETALRQY